MELISVVIWKPIPVDNPRATINFVDYSRLRTEIKAHQLIEHQSTGHTPAGHESMTQCHSCNPQPWAVHSFKLFKASKALSSQHEVVHVNHKPKLCIVYITWSSQHRVIHVIHNPKYFISTRALISRPKVFHVIDSLDLCMTFTTLSSWPRLFHVNHNPELFKESRGLISWPMLFMSSTTLSC